MGCENVFQKGYLQSNLMKVDALLKEHRELCHKYLDNLALRVSYDSLMSHRKMLLIAIEMISSPVPFVSNER